MLAGISGDEPPLDPERLRHSLCQTVVERLRRAGRSIAACSVLLLLPDKTRRAEASQLAIDALLQLRERHPGLEIHVIFGLGTHPLMAETDLEALLGRQRLERLRRGPGSVRQQTTRAPLPSRELCIPVPCGLSAGADADGADNTGADGAGADGAGWTIPMPEALWDCDLILVAGNTELHPYERRGGSGGIHKMLAVGIGAPLVIRRSHSPGVLLDPPGRSRAAGANRFVSLIDAVAESIVTALLQDRSSRLVAPPLGFSLVVNRQGQPLASWLSDRERDRIRLADLVARRQTVSLQRPVSFVIADPELNKATDLLAGARILHLLCMAHSAGNPLLDATAPRRIALLLNPCHEVANQGGIGNRGTVDHLEALRAFRHEEQHRLLDKLPPPGQNAPDPADTWRRSRARLLQRWEEYLRHSGEDEAAMERLIAALERLIASPEGGAAAERQAAGLLRDAIDHSWGGRRRLLEQACTRLAHGVEAAAGWLRQAAASWLFQGLGEGGQRALRLLCLLRHFDELLIITDNPTVLSFLESLDPPLPFPSVDGAPGARLLGLRGADLSQEAISDTLEREWRRHRALCGGGEPGAALIRDPVLPRLRPAGSALARASEPPP
ncbi:MAG: hypothetical protein VKJ44_02455 [Synechococcus sp.]|nr:hypothetical protein [Synechococcus sp.]